MNQPFIVQEPKTIWDLCAQDVAEIECSSDKRDMPLINGSLAIRYLLEVDPACYKSFACDLMKRCLTLSKKAMERSYLGIASNFGHNALFIPYWMTASGHNVSDEVTKTAEQMGLHMLDVAEKLKEKGYDNLRSDLLSLVYDTTEEGVYVNVRARQYILEDERAKTGIFIVGLKSNQQPHQLNH